MRMKKLLHSYRPLTLAFFLLALLPSMTSMAQREYDEEVTLQTFYDELEPYGQWVDDPEYGYVWVPDVDDPEFRPYATNGHWAMTEYGNTWVSDYEWGWAPFHYGRWAFTDYYGWIWIPDTEWGPAWVSWRSNDEYYGWAPLGPEVTVDAAIGNDYYCPDPWWTFVPRTYIYHDHWYDYYVPYYRNRNYISATIIIGNTYRYNNRRYICGPDIYDLRRGGIQVNIFNISNINRPGRTYIRNNYVNIYRPRINADRGHYRPGRLMTRNDFQRHHRDYARRGYNDRNRGSFGNSYGNRGNRVNVSERYERRPGFDRRGNSNGVGRRPEMRTERPVFRDRREPGVYNRERSGNSNGPGRREMRQPENRGNNNPGNRGGGSGFENRRFNGGNNGGNNGGQRPQREYRPSTPSRNEGGDRVSPGNRGGGGNREFQRGGESRNGGSQSGGNNGGSNRGGDRGRRGG